MKEHIISPVFLVHEPERRKGRLGEEWMESAWRPLTHDVGLARSLVHKGGDVGVKHTSGRRERQFVGGEGRVQRAVRAPEGEEGVVACLQSKQSAVLR